jgi:hypothetical protein
VSADATHLPLLQTLPADMTRVCQHHQNSMRFSCLYHPLRRCLPNCVAWGHMCGAAEGPTTSVSLNVSAYAGAFEYTCSMTGRGGGAAYIKRSVCAFEALATFEAACRFRRWRYRGGPPLRLVIPVPVVLGHVCRCANVHLVRSARIVARSLSHSLLLSCPQALRLAAQEPIRTERKQQDSKHDRVAKALIRMPRRDGLLAICSISRRALPPKEKIQVRSTGPTFFSKVEIASA